MSNTRHHKFWTDDEILQAIDLLPKIIEESGGHSISNKSESLQRFAASLGRTAQSVNNRLRKLAHEDDNITINEYGPRRASRPTPQKKETVETPEPTPTPEPQSAKVVNIPLKKLYGLLDYETFMSLINA